jgi:hypothetical protein
MYMTRPQATLAKTPVGARPRGQETGQHAEHWSQGASRCSRALTEGQRGRRYRLDCARRLAVGRWRRAGRGAGKEGREDSASARERRGRSAVVVKAASECQRPTSRRRRGRSVRTRRQRSSGKARGLARSGADLLVDRVALAKDDPAAQEPGDERVHVWAYGRSEWLAQEGQAPSSGRQQQGTHRAPCRR